jgi:membrane-associated phospholipid phosphatase
VNVRNLARIISVAGHPLVTIPLSVAIATGNIRTAALIAATVMIPLAIVIVIQTRRGAWSDYDVSHPEQRSGLYKAALPLLALGTVILYFNGAGDRLLRGMLAGALMMVIGLIATRWMKISMHLMFSTYAAVIVARARPEGGPLLVAVLVAMLLVLAWSRLYLKRHTVAEVVVGAVVGLGAAMLALG